MTCRLAIRRPMTDAEREQVIAQHQAAMLAAQDDDARRKHWQAMAHEIGQRSAAQVARMECERGLR